MNIFLRAGPYALYGRKQRLTEHAILRTMCSTASMHQKSILLNASLKSTGQLLGVGLCRRPSQAAFEKDRLLQQSFGDVGH